MDALLKSVPAGGHGVLFVTLHEKIPTQGRARPHVEVRIDDECIGQLTPQMSQRFLPMVRHLSDRGLVTACWGDISGSVVAAEVRINAVKANEATPEVLNGPAVTIPQLVPALSDPLRYDLTAMRTYLKPLPPVRPVLPRVPFQPPDWAVVRFAKGGGRFSYAALHRGNHWETTATSDWGSINQVMSWHDLASRVRRFDLASACARVNPRDDPRLREHLAVVRFMINDLYVPAINICDDGSRDGDWYTTITDEAAPRLPLGNRATWTDIARYVPYVEVVTSWVQLG